MTTVRERNDLINGFTDTQARDMLAILAGFDPAKFEAALKVLPEMQAIRDALAAAEASPANPYGSAKHGEYTAPSAAAVALCGADWGSATASQRCELIAGHDGVHVDSEGHEFGQTRAHIMSSSPGYYVPPTCPSCSSGTAARLRPSELPCTNPWHAAHPAPTGHLPQHAHGEPGCTYPGCTVHGAAVAR